MQAKEKQSSKAKPSLFHNDAFRLNVRDHSLVHRIGALFLIGNALTLLGAFVGFVLFGAYFSTRSFERELLSVTRVVASTSRAVLAFDDTAGCRRILSALSAKEDIEFAALQNREQKISCTYRRNQSAQAQAEKFEQSYFPSQQMATWSLSTLRLTEPVVLDGESIGVLVIESRLNRLFDQFLWMMPIGLAIALLAALATRFVTKKLQLSLTHRLGALQALAHEVTETKDLSGRIEAGLGDEIDAVSISFNRMLSELQERDKSLTQAKDRAESADRAKSLFVASMSHELRTPLHAILTIADEILDTKLEQDQWELMSVLRSSGKSLLSIINDVLDFSKIEAGRMKMNNESFKLRSFLDRTIKMFALPFRNKGVTLGYSVAPNVPDDLIGDEGRLSQILVNLVGNALKFTPKGGNVMCRVELGESESSEYLGIHFAVEDTGVGIPISKQSEIFEAFTQLPHGSMVTQGTGLGLAITRRLVQAMSGRVWVDSVEGKGSVFHFVVGFQLSRLESGETSRSISDADTASGERSSSQILEIETQRVPPSTSPLPPLPKTDPACASRMESKEPPYRLLVVDDNPVNRALAQRMLLKQGYDVVVAEDGRQAFEMVTSGDPIDLVLMDINMPVMDGLEATKRIRSWEAEQHRRYPIPILALTASVNPEESQVCLDAGMDAFLTKPIDRELFKQAINKYCARRRLSGVVHVKRE